MLAFKKRPLYNDVTGARGRGERYSGHRRLAGRGDLGWKNAGGKRDFMKLSQLQYFQAVCKYGSISKAAEIIHITQPSISNAIRQLEDEFGLNLFYRVNGRLRLTEAGKEFSGHVNEILRKVENTERRMASLGQESSVIKVGIPSVIGSALFPTIFSGFNAVRPDVSFEIHEFNTLESLDLLNSGVLDIVLTTTNEVYRPQMKIHIIRRSPLYFFTNSYHKLAENPVVSVEEFKDTPLILLKENTYQYKAVEALFHAHGCEPNVIHTTNQLATIQHFVRSGLSSTVVIRELMPEDNGLVAIPIKETQNIDIGVIWKADAYLPDALAQFIAFVRGEDPAAAGARRSSRTAKSGGC